MKYWFKNIKYTFDVLSSDLDRMMLIKNILCDIKYRSKIFRNHLERER